MIRDHCRGDLEIILRVFKKLLPVMRARNPDPII